MTEHSKINSDSAKPASLFERADAMFGLDQLGAGAVPGNLPKPAPRQRAPEPVRRPAPAPAQPVEAARAAPMPQRFLLLNQSVIGRRSHFAGLTRRFTGRTCEAAA
jgi:hypothetical protein